MNSEFFDSLEVDAQSEWRIAPINGVAYCRNGKWLLELIETGDSEYQISLSKDGGTGRDELVGIYTYDTAESCISQAESMMHGFSS